jgi:hypothetical protein
MTRPARGIRVVLSRYPFLATILLAFAWLLLMRGLLVLQSGVWPDPGWMLLADSVGALVLAMLLSVIRFPWLRLPLILAMGVAFYVAGQHMWAQGTLFRLAHLGKMKDAHFLASSVMTMSLLMLPLYCLLAFLLHRLHVRIEPEPPARPIRRLAIVVACVAVYGVAVTSLTAPDNNVVVSTLAQIPEAAMARRTAPAPDELEPVERDVERFFFQREVRGGPVSKQPNVLVLVIEGMSGAYLPSVARHHHLTPAVVLPGLERNLETRGFRIYRNVLSLQRQTDRGSYPMLCGSYPRVVTMTPKLADVAAGEADPDCVPDVLARHGYLTGYLQAAPLEYMRKDVFLPRVGFERVQGLEYFEPGEEAEGWGPPDHEFFSGAADWLADLDGEGRPWYAVTLNAGTHHPFPDGAADRSPTESGAGGDTTIDAGGAVTAVQRDRQAAFGLMEDALVALLDSLASTGILDETFVFVTSDEAGGFVRGDKQAHMLDGNFGMLAVRPPDGLSLDELAGADELVSSLDIALTVLDVTGHSSAPAARAMIGRSLLVKPHSATRGLLLGDTYAGHAIFLLESGTFLACGEGLARCGMWAFSPQRPFDEPTRLSARPFLDLSARRRLVDRAAVMDVSHD